MSSTQQLLLGEGAGGAAPTYIEDVFSTYLYTGTGASQTITNGIDLSTKGGLVWFKRRNTTSNHRLYDTARGMVSGTGGSPYLYSNDTAGNLGTGFDASVTSSTTGFNIAQGGIGDISDSGGTYASWTFRKQPKFFDVVTYTGTGSSRTVAHNLGSTPGAIFIKKTSSSSTDGWPVYHRSSSNLCLNKTTQAGTTYSGVITSPTATNFTVSSNADANANGQTYVAYLFAHNAGGFGLTGTDNVISCGSYTGNGSTTGPEVTLGYEPQWLLIRQSSSTGNWWLTDNMQGFNVTSDQFLLPNSSGAEITKTNYVKPLATGFQIVNSDFDVNESGGTYIYIAIRRGPMKVPTSGTSVFSPNAVTMTASGSATITTNFPVDLSFNRKRSAADQYVMDRLRGGSQTSYNYLRTQTTGAETAGSTIGVGFDSNTSLVDNNWLSGVSANTIWWSFQRAPSFFDEVCYTGTGTVRTINHNLGVAPELMIVKKRNATANWQVYQANLGATKLLELNLLDASGTTSTRWANTEPTSSVFTVGTNTTVNNSGDTYVAYLFATCAGVSKVGSYTGTGATQTISCGFTDGARFVLVKRTDSTGDWYVWDTARGMVSGTDPSLLLNSTAAEVNTNSIYTTTGGFQIVSTAAGINASGGTYIYLAIA